MCFAYFRMNDFEKHPVTYIKKNCAFLFSRGYSLKTSHINAEYCFDFYIKDKDNNNTNHICFLWENEYVSCQFSNANSANVNLNTLPVEFPAIFDMLANIQKLDYLIACLKENIEFIDVRPLTELQYAIQLSREKRHAEAYPIFERLYKKESNATNAFNLLQSAVFCGKAEVETRLYERLKNYVPNLKKEPMELSGCFVRLYYGLVLCEVNRGKEAIAIIDYILDVLSHFQITDPTFLYLRGIPPVNMLYDLIQKVFSDEKEKFEEYKAKFISLLDIDTKREFQ